MGNTKMGVLIISPWYKPNIGGIETHLEDLAEYLRMRDYKVFIITYQPLTHTIKPAQPCEKKKNFELRRLNWPLTRFFHLFERKVLLKFLYFPKIFVYSLIVLAAHRREVDVIHAHGLVMAFTATFLSKVFNKRCVVSIHAIYGIKFPPLFLKVLFSNVNQVLVLSRKAKEELLRSGADFTKLTVFTYWVDQSIFKPMNKTACKKALGTSDKFTVLFVGRLFEIKGVKLLLKVTSSCPAITFIFVGSGPLDKEIQSESLRRDNVIFIGGMENRKMASLYNAADVVIVPSLYEEGFGRVILEALSCGIPVIASNRGGIPEALDPSVGVLIEPSVENIKKVISYFYNNREELLKLARNCRKYAEERFGEKNAQIIEESYRI
jgi:glycosyltransferase involved in cell wall biosynthesis